MPAGGLLGMGVGLVGKLALGAIQSHKADKVHPAYTPYAPSPYAQANYGMAQQLYNGRMAGATALEQNILANQSNQQASIARGATDGSQVLALNAAAQGQTNQGFHNLQIQEDQNKYQMLNNLNMAAAGMTQEGDKSYQSLMQKYQMDVGQQNALRQSGLANIFGSVNDVGKLGMMKGMGYFNKNGSGQSPAGGMGSNTGLFDPNDPTTWTDTQRAAYAQNGGNWNG